MRKIENLLAWRYLWGAQQEKMITTMARICFMSIFIGATALTLVMAIMHGFEQVTHEKIQGIHAQITLPYHPDLQSLTSLEQTLAEYPHAVAAWSPVTYRYGMIFNPSSDTVTPIILKGINPAQEQQVSSIGTKIISATTDMHTLPATIHNHSVVIGTKLAQDLGVTPGDTITLCSVGEHPLRGKKLSFATHQADIGGIFSTGIEETDSSLVLCSLTFLTTIFPDASPTELSIKLTPNTTLSYMQHELKKRINSPVISWKDRYPALVAALTLEKYAMFFILALIMLVASMNIMSLLFMQITHKRSDIALLKAMGTDNRQITQIFVRFGMGLSCSAATLGVACALGISWLLETYPFIHLPDVYYVTHLPARMEWHLALFVFATILIISFIAAWFPAQRARKLTIARVLRFEN